MKKVEHLACVSCGKTYEPEEVLYVCPGCGLDRGTLDVVYRYDEIRRSFSRKALGESGEFSQWRYWDLLPLERRDLVPPLRIGWTPFYRALPLERALGVKALYLKDDTGNPSASLKDRASSLAAIRALELGKKIVTGASTGNAASSLACLSAYLGLRAFIFVPERAPRAKVAQLLMYGAKVLMVRGTYDQCFDLCWQATQRWGWYSRNTAINPYLCEGKKTAALEIWEQLGGEVPDRVFCAVGDGCIFGGLFKGFSDLKNLGLIERLPALIGVQAEGAAPLVRAFEAGWGMVQPQEAHTLADSICVGYPRDQVKALRAARQTGGRILAVSDEEILSAQRKLARTVGVFAEPAGAASLAGLIRMREAGELSPDERLVVLVTGNGLKDIESAMKAVDSAPILVEPDIEDVAAKVGEGPGG